MYWVAIRLVTNEDIRGVQDTVIERVTMLSLWNVLLYIALVSGGFYNSEFTTSVDFADLAYRKMKTREIKYCGISPRIPCREFDSLWLACYKVWPIITLLKRINFELH